MQTHQHRGKASLTQGTWPNTDYKINCSDLEVIRKNTGLKIKSHSALAICKTDQDYALKTEKEPPSY